MYTPFCLHRFSDFFEDIWAAYTDQDTQEQGVSTGWKGLDPFYRVRTALPERRLARMPTCKMQVLQGRFV